MAQAGTGGGGGLNPILGNPIFMIVAFFGIFYFLVYRPQSRQKKEHAKMLAELKKGEEIVTQAGLIGKITGITDGEVTLQVQEGVRFRILKSSVQGRYTAAQTPKAEAKAS
jgi:preprotein translocase subunit YajC